jgi:hypothetical protein
LKCPSYGDATAIAFSDPAAATLNLQNVSVLQETVGGDKFNPAEAAPMENLG